MVNKNRKSSEQRKDRYIGIGVSIIIALIGFSSTILTINNSLDNIQKANMIEVTSELPVKFCEFIQNASYAFAFDLNRHRNDISNEEFENYNNSYHMYDSKASELIQEINPLVISYSSKDTVEIYNDFLLDNRELIKDGSAEDYEKYVNTLVAIYAKLPLLYSLIRYDTTGVIRNPSEIFYLIMPQFSKYENNFKDETNKLIKEYNLSSEFKWR